ncbi:hypothetical protein ACFCYH_22860 [Streptomyces sp. NPDC056400]|uniref:hypothetical protein n=1 Tax=Streptomyces sp. NPDC056400 TaxID=3345808 RepID=UPI0035E00F88
MPGQLRDAHLTVLVVSRPPQAVRGELRQVRGRRPVRAGVALHRPLRTERCLGERARRLAAAPPGRVTLAASPLAVGPGCSPRCPPPGAAP